MKEKAEISPKQHKTASFHEPAENIQPAIKNVAGIKL